MKDAALLTETVKDFGRELETLCGAGVTLEYLEEKTGINWERIDEILYGREAGSLEELMSIANALGADFKIVKR